METRYTVTSNRITHEKGSTMTTSQLATTNQVAKLRNIKDQLKPLKSEEKKLVAAIKDKFENGQHVVAGVPFKISEVSATVYDPIDVRNNFPRQLTAMIKAGVFKVDRDNFEAWAKAKNVDISTLAEFAVTRKLVM